jgi:hypothetical protein
VSCGSWLCPPRRAGAAQPIVFSSLLPRPAKKPYTSTLHTPMQCNAMQYITVLPSIIWGGRARLLLSFSSSVWLCM